MDILTKVYDVIKDDEVISKHVKSKNIKFNKYPSVAEMNVPFIVIEDIDDPLPTSYADGDEMAYSYIVQVDVFVKTNDNYNARLVRNELSNRIQRLLWKKLKMGNVSNAKPEYIEEFKTYRSSRVYEGSFYKEEK